MRPIKRGKNSKIYTEYGQAKDDLKNEFGAYCSYCEMNTDNQVDIEHILPKEHYPTLITEWSNFLLACKACNRQKWDKNIKKENYIFPDTDNTAYAYKYSQTKVTVNQDLDDNEKILAQNTLDLVDINRKKDSKKRDDDRVTRSQEWNKALDSLADYKECKTPQMLRQIGRSPSGFFSSWLEIFKEYPEIKKEILENVNGSAMECYDEDINPIQSLVRKNEI